LWFKLILIELLPVKRADEPIDDETAKLVHTLQLHQIELEFQNNELLLAKERAEQAIEKYAELYDFAPLGYFTLSRNSEIVELNLRGSQLLGRERSRLKNVRFDFFISEDSKPAFSQFLENVFTVNSQVSCEVTLLVNNLSPVCAHLSCRLSKSGESCLLTAVDITERKIREDELKRSRILMRASLESQKDMILLSIDLEYRYLYFNTAHSSLMKSAYNIDIKVGMNILECINSEGGRALTKKQYDRVFRGDSHSLVWKFSNHDQNFYESLFNPIFNENKEIVGATTFSRNITDRKRAEEKLRENKARLDKTEEIAQLGSWELNLQSGLLTWSDEVYRIFGLMPQEFAASHAGFLESVHPEDRDAINAAYFGSIQDDQAGYEIEHRVIRRNTGEIRYVLEKCEHFRDASGAIVRSIGMVQDITERKKIENALRESEEIFRCFMEFSPIYVFFKDHNIRTIRLSRNFESMLGKPLPELLGKNMNELFPSALAESMVADDLKILNEGNVLSVEEELNGRFYSTIKFPILIDGTPQFLAGYSMDITEQKQAEQLLKQSEAQITALLAAIPDMIFVQNKEGVYIDYHGSKSAELYVQPDAFIGKHVRDVLPVDVVNQFELASEIAAGTNQVQLIEYSLLLPQGRKYFESKIVAYGGDKILSIVRDVSPYREAEEIIKLKNAALLEINVEKDKFFSIIAHDLRGPFSGLLGLTESMAKKLPDMTLNEIQHITFLMRNSATHLFRLLGNLLEWSCMQRGLIVFDPKSFLLQPRIAESMVLNFEAASKKEIDFSCEIPGDLKAFADENMFDSIIRNLLSNAVKYTSKGGKITLSAKHSADRFVEIALRDTGIGMSNNLIDHLFRIDIQSNRKGTAGEYSTGLGLIICKDFIERHGGKLHIESEEGKGSTFRFTLPDKKKK
jgi:PAS domain S-box-containing protein